MAWNRRGNRLCPRFVAGLFFFRGREIPMNLANEIHAVAGIGVAIVAVGMVVGAAVTAVVAVKATTLLLSCFLSLFG